MLRFLMQVGLMKRCQNQKGVVRDWKERVINGQLSWGTHTQKECRSVPWRDQSCHRAEYIYAYSQKCATVVFLNSLSVFHP